MAAEKFNLIKTVGDQLKIHREIHFKKHTRFNNVKSNAYARFKKMVRFLEEADLMSPKNSRSIDKKYKKIVQVYLKKLIAGETTDSNVADTLAGLMLVVIDNHDPNILGRVTDTPAGKQAIKKASKQTQKALNKFSKALKIEQNVEDINRRLEPIAPKEEIKEMEKADDPRAKLLEEIRSNPQLKPMVQREPAIVDAIANAVSNIPDVNIPSRPMESDEVKRVDLTPEEKKELKDVDISDPKDIKSDSPEKIKEAVEDMVKVFKGSNPSLKTKALFSMAFGVISAVTGAIISTLADGSVKINISPEKKEKREEKEKKEEKEEKDDPPDLEKGREPSGDPDDPEDPGDPEDGDGDGNGDKNALSSINKVLAIIGTVLAGVAGLKKLKDKIEKDWKDIGEIKKAFNTFIRGLSSDDVPKLAEVIKQERHLFTKPYNYAGPNTNLFARLTGQFDSSLPINRLDLSALRHDLFYTVNDPKVRKDADKIMLKEMEPMFYKSEDVAIAYTIILMKSIAENIGFSFGSGLSGDERLSGLADKKELDNVKQIYEDYTELLDKSGINYPLDNSVIELPDIKMTSELSTTYDKLQNDIKDTLDEQGKLSAEDEGNIIFGKNNNVTDISNFTTMSANEQENKPSGVLIANEALNKIFESVRGNPDGNYTRGDKRNIRASANTVIDAIGKILQENNQQQMFSSEQKEFAKALRKKKFNKAIAILTRQIIPKFRVLHPDKNIRSSDIARLDTIKNINLEGTDVLKEGEEEGLDQPMEIEVPPAEQEPEPTDPLALPPPTTGGGRRPDPTTGGGREPDPTNPLVRPPSATEAPKPTDQQLIGPPTQPPIIVDPPLKAPAQPLFDEERLVLRADQIKRHDEDVLDAADFDKLRPDFKTIQMDEVKNELEPIDDKAIKQETIDFSYVPIRGWRSEGNSIYDMTVVMDKLRYSGVHLNDEIKVNEIDRVGYSKPLRKQWGKKTDKRNVRFPKLNKPFFNPTSLERNIPFEDAGFSLNYNTQPNAFDSSNLLAKHWQNSMFVQHRGQTDFSGGVNKKKTGEFMTHTDRRPIGQSAMGLGVMVFDGQNY